MSSLLGINCNKKVTFLSQKLIAKALLLHEFGDHFDILVQA